MKPIIFLMAVLFISCQKEQPEMKEQSTEQKSFVWDHTERVPEIVNETGERIGLFYPLFYKESVSTDNWTTLDTVSIQKAFNKKLIDTIALSRVPKTNRIKIGGVWHLYYKLVFELTNGAEFTVGVVWSVDQGNSVKYSPYGANVIETSGFVSEVTRHKETVKYGNWIKGVNETKHRYSIKIDTTNLLDDYINGTNGGLFVMPHK